MHKFKSAVYLAALLCALLTGPITLADSAQPAAGPSAQPGVFLVKNPWIKLGDDDALMLEADATLVNRSDQPVHIIGVSSGGFRMGMIERVVLQDGIPRNAMVSGLTVPPGQTVQLDSKNYHFMLMGPKTKYKEGSHVKVQLQFQDRDPAIVDFTVSAKAPTDVARTRTKKR